MAPPSRLRACTTKPRVFIISDISNEPDDAESLVRYLLYSNEFDTRGLVACTSTWMKRAVHPEDMEKVIKAYDQVVPNLNKHVHANNQYSSGQYFLDMLRTGPCLYGKEALDNNVAISDGANLLIERLAESEEPLWILCWGGTNVLAQTLRHTAESMAAEDHRRLRAKMRVYAISDQDDTGIWIRHSFPDIFYITSIHGWNQYGNALWTGISGDKFYGFDQGGPDFDLVSGEWIRRNIQIGPLGKAYPDFMFIPEGDTPTFLYLIQNGLGSPEHPNWGSWGGRYLPVDSSRDSAFRHFHDAVDRVVGQNGLEFRSNHATIWRWREAFQTDFAARIQWTLHENISAANHSPVVVVNGAVGPEPLFLEAEAGSTIDLDASDSYDPDGDALSFKWFHYKDVTATQWIIDNEVKPVEFEDLDLVKPGRHVRAILPEKCAVDPSAGLPKPEGQVMHLILEVSDDGTPSMTTYKRVVVQTILQPALNGF
ncbi:cellulose-binding protein [Thozetella sp. PMI_491]|nr:cellulose-binding protein [Thozetella sp. PMI_491]